MRHEFSIRIYYEDTDAAGIVYHARYLHFADRARTELLRQNGISLQQLAEEEGRVFLVRSLTVHYRKPIFLDDEITVCSEEMETSISRSIIRQVIERNGEECARLEVELVCLDRATNRPGRFPPQIVSALGAYRAAHLAR